MMTNPLALMVNIVGCLCSWKSCDYFSFKISRISHSGLYYLESYDFRVEFISTSVGTMDFGPASPLRRPKRIKAQ